MARRTDGPRHARKTDASTQAQRRLEAILQTLSGEKTVAEVCADLGINEARFHVIRKQALQAAAERLEPQPTGRPPRIEDPKDARIEELQVELQRKAVELRAAEIRAELALTMPDVISGAKKKDPSKQGVRAKLRLSRRGRRTRKKA